MVKVVWMYALLEPETQAVRYVGCTEKPFERFRNHVWCNENKYNPALCDWIKSLKRRGICPGFVILERVRGTWKERGLRERQLVEKYEQEGCSLFNRYLTTTYAKP